MKVVERKTSDPANYPKLGVEAPDKPTATSTLVEVRGRQDLATDRRQERRRTRGVRAQAEGNGERTRRALPQRRAGSEALDRPPAHRRSRRTGARHRRATRDRTRLSTDPREARRCGRDPQPDSEGPHAGEQHVARLAGGLAGVVQLRRRATGATAAARPPPTTPRTARSTARSSSSPVARKPTRRTSPSRRTAMRRSRHSSRNRRPRLRPRPAAPAAAAPAAPAAPAATAATAATAAARRRRTRPASGWPRAPRGWNTRFRSTSTNHCSAAWKTCSSERRRRAPGHAPSPVDCARRAQRVRAMRISAAAT